MDDCNVDAFQDNSCHGEDAYLVRELASGAAMDCVLDGVTHCEGAYASGFTKDLLAKGVIKSIDDVVGLLRQANDVLFQAGQGRNLLTTIVLVFYQQRRACVLSVGDSSAYLVRDSAITHLTPPREDRELNALAGGAIGLKGDLEYDSNTLDVQPGDLILLASDGLLSNLTDTELCAALDGSISAYGAVERLRVKFIDKRESKLGRDGDFGSFREDDVTAIVRFIP